MPKQRNPESKLLAIVKYSSRLSAFVLIVVSWTFLYLHFAFLPLTLIFTATGIYYMFFRVKESVRIENDKLIIKARRAGTENLREIAEINVHVGDNDSPVSIRLYIVRSNGTRKQYDFVVIDAGEISGLLDKAAESYAFDWRFLELGESMRAT